MRTFKSESEFTRWFCKMVEAYGAKTVAFVGSKMQVSGIPDRYIAHPLFRGWVEMKRNKRKCTTLQHDFIRDMKRCGDVALVVRLVQGEKHLVIFEDENENKYDTIGLYYLMCIDCDKQRGKYLLESLGDVTR